jgi:hypothetical protein
MMTAKFDRPDGPTSGTAGVAMMRAIVQSSYGTAPEEVLRLTEAARPRSETTRSWCGWPRPGWIEARGM